MATEISRFDAEALVAKLTGGRRVTIGAKLLGGFAVMVGLFMLMGWVSITRMASIDEGTKRIFEEDLEALVSISELEEEALDVEIEMSKGISARSWRRVSSTPTQNSLTNSKPRQSTSSASPSRRLTTSPR